MRTLVVATAVGLVAGGTWAFMSRSSADSFDAQPVAAAMAPAVLPLDRLSIPLTIVPGETFSGLVAPWSLSPAALQSAAGDLHNFSSVRMDRELALEFWDGRDDPVALRYELDDVRTLVVESDGPGWQAHLDEVEFDATLERFDVSLTDSLWQSAIDAGLRGADVARIAEVFEYVVDFNTELKRGAELVLLADHLRSDLVEDRLGEIHLARLVNAGETHTAIRFEHDDGQVTFYNPQGVPFARHFLRSPLRFSRVSSGYNPRRFHPILKKRRPHNGTDFAASAGTRVRSVADGVVTHAGRNGGHGLFVKVKHDGTWETSYSHLSKVEVRKGQRISQGKTIGRVGSTGMSTGPHLHYQMWKHGRFVDPMRAKLPSAPPLEGDAADAFGDIRDHWLGQLSDGVVTR